MRSTLPGEVTVTAVHHPLFGVRLVVEGRRRVRGVPCLIVRLPDGTPGTVEVDATDAASAPSDLLAGTLLSAEGVRRLRRLLAPRRSSVVGGGT